jgi:hypothetical protein
MSEYQPDDRSMLGDSPWRPSDPKLQAWEQAHGHDVRMDCAHRDCCDVLLAHEASAGASPLTQHEQATLDQHRDDGHGGCLVCREWDGVTFDDDDSELVSIVALPCPVVRLSRSAGAASLACSSCGTKAMLSYCHECYWRMVNRARLAEGTDR